MASSSLFGLLIFMAFFPSLLTSQLDLQTSTISAAPALLPYPPLSAPPPVLSPDISPLFPSPSGSGLTPSEEPTIPSSPSPPNPDAVAAPEPGFAGSPTGSLPESASAVSGGSLSSFVALVLLAVLLTQLDV